MNWSRPRWEEVPPDRLRGAGLSPTGRRALFEWRGELFSVPAGEGSWRNLTRTPGVADRHPVWSPDGSRIAWFNDAGGEYGLVVAGQDGSDPRRIDIPEPSFYFRPEWSPDGAKLAFTDTHYRLLVLDVASGAVDHVDTDRFAHPERSMNPVWSPDSRWRSPTPGASTTSLRAIFVHDTEVRRDAPAQRRNGGRHHAPCGTPSGKHLYFLASTNYALNTGWLDMTSYDRPGDARPLPGAAARPTSRRPSCPAATRRRALGSTMTAGRGRQGRGLRGRSVRHRDIPGRGDRRRGRASAAASSTRRGSP